ncbi:GNAT family N-acetyltransferase [Chitinimonas sp.]|uniref:GNAT family N-acetyltransferase n=1 Tax=Chitinimonas sp. TaxID=1934313 RepID=UPI0035AE8C64
MHPAFDTVKLRTERLLLRPMRPSDADDLFAVFSDPEVMRYWSTPPWTSREQAEQLIARDLQTLASGEHLRLGLIRKADERLIGNCSLFNFMPQCRRAEIGYGLASNAWGQGLMHEALSALLHFAFDTLQLHRLEADIDPRNAASAKALTRLGFEQEGLLRERWIVDDEVSDSALYGLLRRDWRARR